MSTGHVSSIDKIQSGNEHLDRVQDQLRAKLNPVLTSTILNAKKYRWNEMAYPLPSSPICWLLQTFSSGAWTTVVAFDQSGKVIPGAWIAPTLLNSWVQTAGRPPVGFFKDALGIVRLRGCVNGGVLTNAAFALPAGYRPSGFSAYLFPVSSPSTGNGTCNVQNGFVVPFSGSAGEFNFAGISFLGEQ